MSTGYRIAIILNSHAIVWGFHPVDSHQGEPIRQGGIYSWAKQEPSTTLDPEPIPKLWMNRGVVVTDKPRQVDTLQACCMSLHKADGQRVP